MRAQQGMKAQQGMRAPEQDMRAQQDMQAQPRTRPLLGRAPIESAAAAPAEPAATAPAAPAASAAAPIFRGQFDQPQTAAAFAQPQIPGEPTDMDALSQHHFAQAQAQDHMMRAQAQAREQMMRERELAQEQMEGETPHADARAGLMIQ